MSIIRSAFGFVKEGQPAACYTLTNASGASLSLCDYGARIVSIRVPDRGGRLGEVCLGFDSVAPYTAPQGAYLGATIGRVANRISGASFALNGTPYAVSANENGNCLHGGFHGFESFLWESSCQETLEGDSVTFRRVSPDGEEGFPGALTFEVSFFWNDACELSIRYHAVSDRDTLCAATNHAYFNLDGSDDVLAHTLCLHSDLITVTDSALIPTGEERAVDGLPVDLRVPLLIGDGIRRSAEYPIMAEKNGYDFNFRISGEGMRPIGMLHAPHSGRAMYIRSTEPCVQVYSGQGLNCIGHGGRHYGAYAGIALETQHHPDAIHHAHFPDIVLHAGQEYHSQTIYHFTVE